MASNGPYRAGFTLVELLVALAILVIVLGIIYGSFSSVIFSTEDARRASFEMRTRQFLSRSFTANLAQATEGWSPGAAYRALRLEAPANSSDAVIERGIMRYSFLGEDGDGAAGPADRVSFATSAALAGGAGLPGTLKLVTYEVIDLIDADDEVARFDGPESTLRVTETPIAISGTGFGPGTSSGDSTREQMAEAAAAIGMGSAEWEIPIESLDIQYFDGKDWVNDWDSQQAGRLPWALRISIDFPGEEPEPRARKNSDIDEHVDFTMVLTVPAGAGVLDEPPDYVRPEDSTREGN